MANGIPEYVNHVKKEGPGMSDESDTSLQFQVHVIEVPRCLLFVKLA